MTSSPEARAPIGVFDSGVGGLTVLAALRAELPGQDFVYLGDTARLPYGNKSPATVCRYSYENTLFLLERGVQMVVVACNTASAEALPALSRHIKTPVIGVIDPGARAAAEASTSGRIGVIGTRGTVASGAYDHALRALRQDVHVVSVAGPLLVPLAEEGWMNHPAARLIAQEYLAPLLEADVDTLLLGCTHYPVLRELLSEVAGPKVTIVDSALATADAVRDRLGDPGPSSRDVRDGGTPPRRGSLQVFLTDGQESFRAVGERFLGETLQTVEVARPWS